MIERDLALHTFPDGYQVVVETATNPGRKTGRINWKGGHPGNYGHDQPFVTTNSL